MPPPSEIIKLRGYAAVERRRADRAAALAGRYEVQAVEGTDRLRPAYARMAQAHRQLQERHLAAAALHEMVAERADSGNRADRAVRFMEAVAGTLGIRGAAAALHGQRARAPVLVTASDQVARNAYQLESQSGEGPAMTAMTVGQPVTAVGPQVPARWHRYGPALAGLGIHGVCAVPLQLPSARFGVLCCYDTQPDVIGMIVPAADTISHVLGGLLLRSAPGESLSALIDS